MLPPLGEGVESPRFLWEPTRRGVLEDEDGVEDEPFAKSKVRDESLLTPGDMSPEREAEAAEAAEVGDVGRVGGVGVDSFARSVLFFSCASSALAAS